MNTPSAPALLAAPVLAAGAVLLAGVRTGRSRLRDLASRPPGTDPHSHGEATAPDTSHAADAANAAARPTAPPSAAGPPAPSKRSGVSALSSPSDSTGSASRIGPVSRSAALGPGVRELPDVPQSVAGHRNRRADRSAADHGGSRPSPTPGTGAARGAGRGAGGGATSTGKAVGDASGSLGTRRDHRHHENRAGQPASSLALDLDRGRALRVLLASGVRLPRADVRRIPAVRVGLPVLAGGVVLSLTTSSPVPLVVALPAAVFLIRRGMRAEAQREFTALRTGVAELATAMVGELRAGQQPSEAFAAAVDSSEGPIRARLTEAVAVARIGGDVPAALDRAAGPPGADSLVRVAACWRIAAERGAGFAPALGRVAAGLRAEEAGHQEAAAELSGARSTARLLAALPAFGIVLGHLGGARPLDVLLHTPVGFVCLATGLLLVALGLLWTDRIAQGGGPWTA